MDERTIVLLTFALACFATVRHNALQAGLLEEARELSRAQNDPTRTSMRGPPPEVLDANQVFAYGMSRQAHNARLEKLGRLMMNPRSRVVADTHEQNDDMILQMTLESERRSVGNSLVDLTRGPPLVRRGLVPPRRIWDAQDWAQMGIQ